MFGDRYELLQRLGAGGMARVYLARDTVLGRTVAIKVLHTELDENEEVRARFLREARIFARLKHPHIVDIYDVVTTPEGAAAMVMEYVEGTDLHRVLASNPRLVPELAALVIRPLADALHYAHREGVVHRDVKPANVLLGRDGSVKLSDFGIAKASEEDLLTRTGDFLGTPAYIAPEQARGDAIGPAADQYALGVVLFEMVTGKRPFSGPNTLAVLTKIMAGEYPDPRELNAAVDDDLAAIIARSLSLDAADRFPDLGAMVTALERYHITVNADRQRGLIAGLVDDPNGTADVVAGEVANELITTARRAAEKGDKRNARKSVQAALARKPDLEAAHQLLRTLEQPTVDLMPPAQGGTTTTSTLTVGAGRRGPVVVGVALALTAVIGVGITFLLRTHPPGS
ncbi:MAG: serine/threonine protein kinase, partial [Myxococcales bacterium]|nr:serine/threonine protein kinase [Myxococcales bacterium]